MIGIGAKVNFVPAGFSGEKKAADPFTGREIPRAVTGVVTWIHPKGRYYMVEYTCNGYTMRESFCSGKRTKQMMRRNR